MPDILQGFLCVCDWTLHGIQLLELFSVPSGQCAYSPTALIPRLGRSPGEGTSNRLQSSCLENSMNRGAWRATVYGVAESDIPELLSTQAPVNISNLDWELFQNRSRFLEAFCASMGRNSTCHFLMVTSVKTPYLPQRGQGKGHPSFWSWSRSWQRSRTLMARV